MAWIVAAVVLLLLVLCDDGDNYEVDVEKKLCSVFDDDVDGKKFMFVDDDDSNYLSPRHDQIAEDLAIVRIFFFVFFL